MADVNKTVKYLVELDGKISPSFKKIQKNLGAVDKQVNNINKTTVGPKINGKAKKGVNGLSKSFGGLTDSLKNALSSLSPMGAELAGLAAPAAITVAAIAAIGTVLVGVANDIEKVDKQVRKFTDNAGEIKTVSDNMRALEKTFDNVDVSANLKAANVAAKEFGITISKAQELISKTTVAGGGIFDPELITEYASQMKGLGFTAQDTFSLIAQAQQEGLNVDKTLDTFKEFGLRIREMGKAQEDALKGAGIDPTQLTKDLESGAKSQREIYNEVFSKEGLSKKQKQTLVADLLGGPGEDLGERGISQCQKFWNRTKD